MTIPTSRLSERLDHHADQQSIFRVLYDRLLLAFGRRGKWFGTDNRFEICVGAILVQSTAWRNVEIAIERLRAANALSSRAIVALSDGELTDLIRSAGFAQVKRRRLRAFADKIAAEFNGEVDCLLALPFESLREHLLATHGIGRETADVICVYAAKYPVFVMDAYAERIFGRIGPGTLKAPRTTRVGTLVPSRSITNAVGYLHWQSVVTAAFPQDAELLGEFHALIIQLGKRNCVKQRPKCETCPVRDLCVTGLLNVPTNPNDK